MHRDPALAALLERRGMLARIARACGVSRSSVSEWRMVPTRHLRTVAEVAEVPVEDLIPAKPRAEAAS